MGTEKTLTRRQVIRAAGVATAATALVGGVRARARAQSRTQPAEAREGDAAAVGVALVGAAHIHTPQYVNAMKKRPTVRMVSAWDHDADRAAKAAGELGCPVAPSLDAIWKDPDVKAIVVCSETNRHHDIVTAAAKAGKHMFVEKPLGSTAKESYAMAAAIEKAGVLFTTGYFRRTTREHLFLKQQVANGAFGTVTRVRGSNCHNGSLGGWFDGEYRWMADPKVAGVGAFGDLGTHSLDILMWLFGPVDAVAADIKVVTGRYAGCDESGEALLKFESGVTGTLAGGWVDVDNPVSLIISGTEGHATLLRDALYFKSSKVDGADGKDPWTKLPEADIPPIEQFFDAVEGKPHTAMVTPAEAASRVAVMEAAYQGAKSGTWAKVAKK